MKKLKRSLFLLGLILSVSLINVSSVFAKEDVNNQSDDFIKLVTVDLSNMEDQKFEIVLPNGKKGTVLVENVDIPSTRSDVSSLSGSFNKKFTFTEGSPLITMSAYFSGNVTSSSVNLNKPSNGTLTGLINVDASSREYFVETYSSTDKTAVFQCYYSFPYIGTSHVMQLRLNVVAGSKNNATLFTHGIF